MCMLLDYYLTVVTTAAVGIAWVSKEDSGVSACQKRPTAKDKATRVFYPER